VQNLQSLTTEGLDKNPSAAVGSFGEL